MVPATQQIFSKWLLLVLGVEKQFGEDQLPVRLWVKFFADISHFSSGEYYVVNAVLILALYL